MARPSMVFFLSCHPIFYRRVEAWISFNHTGLCQQSFAFPHHLHWPYLCDKDQECKCDELRNIATWQSMHGQQWFMKFIWRVRWMYEERWESLGLFGFCMKLETQTKVLNSRCKRKHRSSASRMICLTARVALAKQAFCIKKILWAQFEWQQCKISKGMLEY